MFDLLLFGLGLLCIILGCLCFLVETGHIRFVTSCPSCGSDTIPFADIANSDEDFTTCSECETEIYVSPDGARVEIAEAQ